VKGDGPKIMPKNVESSSLPSPNRYYHLPSHESLGVLGSSGYLASAPFRLCSNKQTGKSI